jgi:prevent-host-death family protein
MVLSRRWPVYSLTEDFKTASELKKRLRAVLEQIHRTGRPVVVTVNRKPDTVLIDVQTFEHKLRALNLVGLLSEGEEDIRRGRTRAAGAFLKAFKLPRRY